jgi:hypothetical protein
MRSINGVFFGEVGYYFTFIIVLGDLCRKNYFIFEIDLTANLPITHNKVRGHFDDIIWDLTWG